jgi:hypothetical protein
VDCRVDGLDELCASGTGGVVCCAGAGGCACGVGDGAIGAEVTGAVEGAKEGGVDCPFKGWPSGFGRGFSFGRLGSPAVLGSVAVASADPASGCVDALTPVSAFSSEDFFDTLGAGVACRGA